MDARGINLFSWKATRRVLSLHQLNITYKMEWDNGTLSQVDTAQSGHNPGLYN